MHIHVLSGVLIYFEGKVLGAEAPHIFCANRGSVFASNMAPDKRGIEDFQIFLAHLSLLRVSFWDTVMSVIRRTCGRP